TTTPLSKPVMALCVLELISVVNPLQGGLQAGLAGLLFAFVPTLGFWIGRTLIDDAMMRRIFRVVSILAVLAALYGTFQIVAGFPKWDKNWIVNQGYASLNVGGITRPFASFASATEYAHYMAVGIICWFGLYVGRRG